MAVSIILTPNPLALTKGGMRFQLQGSGRYQTRGSKSITVLEFRTAIPDGTTLNLRWNGQTVSIIARTNPVEANEFPAGDGSTDYARDILAPFFQHYFPFREDFEAGASNFGAYRGIVLTAKQPGPAYSVLGLNNTTRVLGGPAVVGPITVDPVAIGGNPLLRDRYSGYVELWLQKPGTPGTNVTTDFERVHDAIIEADDSGLVEFDAGDLLHGLLQADLPDFLTHQPTKALTSHRAYYVAYAEAFGQPIRVGQVRQDIVRHAYLGGGNFEHRAGTGVLLERLIQGASTAGDKALRFGPPMRYVRSDEPQWLTFLNARTTVTDLILDVYVKFSDQTTTNLTIYPPLTPEVGDKLTYAVGPAQLDLFNRVPAGMTIQEYFVKIRTTDADYSVQYRYVLNYAYEPYVRHFAYLNSLGAFDTLTTFGKGTQELQRFYKQAQRSLPAEYSVSEAQYVDYDLSIQQSTEVTTGFREQAELRRWHDFYRSPVRFRMRGTQAIQIGIVSKSIKQAKDGDTQFAHRFEYVDLHRDEFYSEDPETGDPAPPPGLIVGGSPVISVPPAPINAVDPTVPAAARSLTNADLTGLRQLRGVGLHTLAGYLTQAGQDGLYFRRDQGVDYRVLTNTPTTRDDAGLTDVLTDAESKRQIGQLIKNMVGIKTKLKSWTGEVEPQ